MEEGLHLLLLRLPRTLPLQLLDLAAPALAEHLVQDGNPVLGGQEGGGPLWGEEREGGSVGGWSYLQLRLGMS